MTTTRLTPLDASFLYMESPVAHMHVGALVIYEDPHLTEPALQAHVAARLHRVPRYRQKLAWVPGHVARPCWVDDPEFSVGDHVRLVRVPSPGDEALLGWASELLGRPLDRRRPLWELWAAPTGDGRLAVLFKAHHCLVDGLGAVDLGAAIMDLQPAGVAEAPPAWKPAPVPGRLRRLADAVGEHGDRIRALWTAGRALARDPGALAGWGREAWRGMVDLAGECLAPAPRTSFNEPIGSRRRFEVARGELHEIKRIKDHFGCTINDVILAAVTGGMRRLMRARGEPMDGDVLLRAMVPVNRRGLEDRETYGNRVSWMVTHLPVSIASPAERLCFVHEAMDGAKRSQQSSGAELLFAASEHVAPPALALTCRAVSRFQRTFNLIVTNVPGPQFPLYLAGGEMREAFPVVPIVGTTSLGIAILSYNGKLFFGLQADADLFGDDLAALAGAIESSLQDLCAQVPRPEQAPAPGHAPRRRADTQPPPP